MELGSDSFFKHVSELSGELDKCEGQQIYVLVQEENVGCTGFRGHFGQRDIHVETKRYMGVLGKPPTILDYSPAKPMFGINTTKHVEKRDGREWELEEGPFHLYTHLMVYRDKELPVRDGSTLLWNDFNLGSRLGRSLRIVVGEDKIAQQIESEQPDFRLLPITSIDWALALDMLGLPIPKPIIGEYEDHKRKETSRLISELWSRTRMSENLEVGIAHIYDAVITGGRISGGAVELIEDEGDALVVSIGRREDLRTNEAEIRSLLEDALRLKLDKSDVELEPYSGIRIDVDRFVKELCKSYKVKN